VISGWISNWIHRCMLRDLCQLRGLALARVNSFTVYWIFTATIYSPVCKWTLFLPFRFGMAIYLGWFEFKRLITRQNLDNVLFRSVVVEFILLSRRTTFVHRLRINNASEGSWHGSQAFAFHTVFYIETWQTGLSYISLKGYWTCLSA